MVGVSEPVCVASRYLVRVWSCSSRRVLGRPRIELRQLPLEEAAFGVVVDQCQGSVIGLAGLVGAPQTPQQLTARGVQVVVVLQVLLACWAGACPVCKRPAPRW